MDGLFRVGYDTAIITRTIPVPSMFRAARAVGTVGTLPRPWAAADFPVGAFPMGPIASKEWCPLLQPAYREPEPALSVSKRLACVL